MKPLRNKFMRLEKMLKSFSYKELKEYILNCIHTNDSSDSNDTNDLNDINNLNDTNNSNDSSDSNK